MFLDVGLVESLTNSVVHLKASDVKDRIVSRKVGEHGFEYFEERFDPGTGLKRGLANLGGFASHLASSQLEKFRI